MCSGVYAWPAFKHNLLTIDVRISRFMVYSGSDSIGNDDNGKGKTDDKPTFGDLTNKLCLLIT